MLDISIVSIKARTAVTEMAETAAEDALFVRHPNDAPPSFTDAHRRIIERFVALIPEPERATYLSAVDARFGTGAPGTAAVKAACVAAALSYVSLVELHALGLADLPTKNKVDVEGP